MADYQRLATSNSAGGLAPGSMQNGDTSSGGPTPGAMEAPSPRIAHLQRKIASSQRLPNSLKYLFSRALSASARLTFSTKISDSIEAFRRHTLTRGEKFKYAILLAVATFSLFIMEVPGFPLKLVIPLLFAITILVPVTSQFFLPAAPIFAWLIFFYSSKFIPAERRPHIWVSLLPTLETVWYGASISDILTRFGHPALDIFAWIPYGVVHFAGPFLVAASLFIFGPPGSVKVFGGAFGFMNLIGVVIQIVFPCAPPWYELREGLTPANYGMKGSPAGLARIDKLFGGHGYTLTFSNAPVPFGAFPSLHAGSATMEALFCSYFFPLAITFFKPRNGVPAGKNGRWQGLRLDVRILYWLYAAWLYWCTMYLMHHYLIDLVAGGCLATMCFYFFLSDEMREAMELHYPYRSSSPAPPSAAPSPLRPASAFAVRRYVHQPPEAAATAATLSMAGVRGVGTVPSITVQDTSDEYFDIGEDEDEDGTAQDATGRGDAMQMKPLLAARANQNSHKLSKRRDVIFSASDVDQGSSSGHSTDGRGGNSQGQRDGNYGDGMPPLNRMQSASRAA